VAVGAAIWSLLLWQQFHDGVPSHSFMARDDMPSISNWWGALTLPLLTWFTLGNIGTRRAAGLVTTRGALAGGLSALLFGAVLAGAYAFNLNAIPNAQIGMVPLIALFVPIYRAEFVLGFVLALSYTFGGVLPLIIGGVLAAAGAVIHLAPRWVLRRALRRFRVEG